jgi:hypothetical protein
LATNKLIRNFGFFPAMIRYTSLLVLSFFLLIFQSHAQSLRLSGKVIDGDTKEPLAFVSIGIKGSSIGAISDIDGKWLIPSAGPSDSIVFSLVGYYSIRTTIGKFNEKYPGGVAVMAKSTYNLKEVTIKAAENPAHRIIQKALDHKKQNNWERLSTYSYTTYDKFKVTQDKIDSVQGALEEKKKKKGHKNSIAIKFGDSKKDSAGKTSTDSFFEAQHLFLVESVTEKFFKYPDKVKETVIASKVSGIADPRFSLIATQFNNFNIYKDYVEVGSKSYFSPLAYGCINKYFYNLEDSIHTLKDTIYVIGYRPRRNTLFNGFEGLLYISTRNYAVQNVIAVPQDIDAGINTEIQQQFVRIDNKQWFPEQINAKMIFGGADGNKVSIVGKGKSYIKNIRLNPDLSHQKFNNVVLNIDKNAGDRPDSFWERSRGDTLSRQDKQTYKIIDSVGKLIHLDRRIKYFEALLNGRLPIGPIDLPLKRIFDYNGYEGFRLGLGAYTNNKISSYFSVGGYGAYGFKDKAWKYGAELFLTPVAGSPFQVSAAYYNDVTDLGGVNFPLDRKPYSKEPLRNLNINQMYSYEKEVFALRISPFRYMTLQPEYSQSIEKSTNNYRLFRPDDGSLKQFYFSEAGIGLRYAYKEKFIQLLDKRYSEGTKWPVIWSKFTQGLDNFGKGEFNFRRYDLKIEKRLSIKLAGHSDVQIRGGYVEGVTPLMRLYNGNGNHNDATIASQNTFETMRPYEFFSSKYVAIFYSHSFEKLLVKIGYFQPVIKIYGNAGIGAMNNPGIQQGIQFKTMEKGYYETGFSIENLLKSSFSGSGIGFYYRVGPYSDAKWKNNIFIKYVITSSIFGN